MRLDQHDTVSSRCTDLEYNKLEYNDLIEWERLFSQTLNDILAISIFVS